MTSQFVSQFGSILLAALGISFLIFIHEAGHFAAARLFGVRVETFSLGFGPRLWGIRRGGTDYRLSAVPLGGYVKMAGEYGDYREDDVPAPDELMAKPPWQRAIIFSGGVIVNFAFAFLVFPLAFSLGVPFTAPIIGSVTPGGAAWSAGVEPGDEIVAVNGNRIYQFPDIGLEVALGDPRHMLLHVRRDGHELDLPVHPIRSESLGRYELGVSAAASFYTEADTPAARAGLRSGDRLLTINGADVTRTPIGSGGLADRDMLLGRPLDVVYERDGVQARAHIEPEPGGALGPVRLGVMPLASRVAGVRGLLRSGSFPLHEGDVVLGVAGEPVFNEEGILAALRDAPPGDVALDVRRASDRLALTLPAAQRDAVLAGDAAFDNDFDGTHLQVLPSGALAAAGLVDGDEILTLNDEPVQNYRDLQDLVGAPGGHFSVHYRRAADGAVATTAVDARETQVWDYGIGLQSVEVVRKEGLAGALRAGFDTSINIVRTTWLTLTKLFTGQVASKNLGGIVSISVLTYHFADGGLTQLLFFLGLLSINLGFINVLPVPVLDGGQVLLLLFEKIKGRRLSERFMNWTQLAGLLAIVALVLYVTYNDIDKLLR